jgi:hypothetical protein
VVSTINLMTPFVTLTRAKAPQVVGVCRETDAAPPWLLHALTAAGIPVVCMDARQSPRGAFHAARQI